MLAETTKQAVKIIIHLRVDKNKMIGNC